MNDLTIEVESLRRVELITVDGRIDSNSAQTLDKKLKDVLAQGRYNLVLNLGGVTYMSSAGLRVVVVTLRECKKHGGDLRLSTPSKRISDVLSLAGLTSLFTVFEDNTTAVGSF